MREKYPPKSSSSSSGSSTSSESIDTPMSSSVDTSTSMTEQWQSPFEERPVSLPTEVQVTSRDVLRSWAVSAEIPHQHLTSLLKVMRQMTPEELYSLPLDARTLPGGAGDLPLVTALGGGERTGRPGPQQPRRRRRASMRQGLRWLMHSVAMLIGQVSEMRQQQAAMMDLHHGHRGMSSSPCESTRFNLSPVDTPEQLDALTNALGEEAYRHQL
nr:unnamed protein product [Spirometra erinaceieuropaei]